MFLADYILGLEKAAHAAEGNSIVFFFRGSKRVVQHVEGELMEYQHTAQSEATQHLKALCEALQQSHNMDFNPNASEDRKPSPEAKDVIHNLKVINDSIARQNKEHKLDTDLGNIRYNDPIGKWRPIFIDPQLVNNPMPGLLMFCDSYHYPREWATLPGEPAQGGTSNQSPQDTNGQIPANAINAQSH